MSNMGFTALHFKLPAKQKATAQCLSLQVATKFTAIFTQERFQTEAIYKFTAMHFTTFQRLVLDTAFCGVKFIIPVFKSLWFELIYSSAKVEKAMAGACCI